MLKARIALAAVIAAVPVVILDGGAAIAGFSLADTVKASSERDSSPRKTVEVTCAFEPVDDNDYTVGGATVTDGGRAVALQASSPVGRIGWKATTVETDSYDERWRLKVKALCIDS